MKWFSLLMVLGAMGGLAAVTVWARLRRRETDDYDEDVLGL